MEKIRLGRTEMMVTQLGFGGIPIQRLSDDEAVAVVRRCLELGITFIDTANSYTNSEERIGKAITGRREGLILATKTAARSRQEAENHLKLSLERLGVEYIDLYQLHNVSDAKAMKEILAPDGPLAVVEKAKRAGMVKHIGITSHSIDIAKELVKTGHFETVMFPFNFVTSEPAIDLLSLAREQDVGFIAMKPLAGGRLDNAAVACKYLLQFPDVVLIPGIEKVSEIEEIVRVVEGPWQMTTAEQTEMESLKQELGQTFCRRCDYCQPCTEGIPISVVMNYPTFGKRLPSESIFSSGFIVDALGRAANCTRCGECEERCPYKLPIREMMEEYVDRYMVDKKQYEEQTELK
ncbi:aldo/keto reductase [Chloroflexota bacterium]